MVQFANVVVYSYQYLLDPKVAGIISKEMQRESVVVFDEAHNIDNVCIEALSVSVRQQTLEGATWNLNKMTQEIERYLFLGQIFSFYMGCYKSFATSFLTAVILLIFIINSSGILRNCGVSREL